MSIENIKPRIAAFGRQVIVQAFAGLNNQNDPVGRAAIFNKLFPQHATRELVHVQKTGEVGAHSTTTAGSELAGNSPSAQFLAAIVYAEILGKLGALDVPPRTNFGAADGLFAAGVVAEGAPIPLHAPSFDRLTVSPIKIAGLAAATLALLRRGNAASIIGAGLRDAVVRGTDAALLSDSASYGLLYGVDPAGTGADSVDAIDFQLNAMLDGMSGADLSAVSLIVSPKTAKALSLIRLDGGQQAYPTVTVRGGTIAGLPLIVSTGAADDRLVAIDGSAVVKADEGLEVDVSRNASIQMSSAPTGSAVTPTGGTTTIVNVFQNESAAIRVVRSIGWELRRDNAVGWLDDFVPGDAIVTA